MNKLTKLSRAIFAIAMMLTIGFPSIAHDFEVDGIFYNITNPTTYEVAITTGDSKYTGNIIIPETVVYDNVLYTVSSINSNAFANCSELNAVTIGKSIVEIGNFAFNGCTNLTNLIIEDSLNSLSIGYNSYSTSIGKGLFYDCPLEYLYIGRNIKYDSSSYYGYSPFARIETLTTVEMGNSVTSIKESAFKSCSKLGSMIIPNSVKSISNHAFDGCGNLSKLIIEDSPNSLSLGYNSHSTSGGKGLFYDCPLEYLYIGRDIKYDSGDFYGYSPFARIKTLTTVEMGNSVTQINDYLFYYCNLLSSISLGNSVKSIGSSAFSYCTKLTSVTIPKTVTTIGNSVFKGCSGLGSITIPNSVTEIGNYAFEYCSSLTNIKFDDGVSSLILGVNLSYAYGSSVAGEGLFYDCPLKQIYLGRNIQYSTNKLDGYSPFYKKSALNTIEIGDSVTVIPSYLFSNCTSVTSVSIPNSITSIGSYAFESCSGLTSVSLGNSISTIEYSAFKSCDKLLNVTSLNPMPHNIDATVFSSRAYTNATLTVPYNCSGVYAGRTGWGSFDNIVEMEMPKIYLTLKFPESGTITHKEVYEEAVDLSFKANEGWEINNITFNEEDITAEVDDEGNYTTPVLTADAILVVVFEKIDTSIESVSEKNDIKVYANNGEVNVIGTDAQSEVAIYNSIGALIYKGYDKTINLDGNGVYILTVEGRTFKFAL